MPTASIWLPPLILAHLAAAAWVCCSWWWRCKRQVKQHDIHPACPPTPPPPPLQVPRQQAALLVWQHIRLTVQDSASRGSYLSKANGASKVLLQGVSGQLSAGSLDVVLGPTGCGKSTLLEVLSGRAARVGVSADQPKLQGKVVYGPAATSTGASGQLDSSSSDAYLATAAAPATFPAGTHVCYVPQHDLLLPCMTTLDTLQFAYRLAATCDNNSSSAYHSETSPAAVASVLDDVLQLLGLQHCRDVQIGGVLPGGGMLRGLSGGERKRVAIAAAVVSIPGATAALTSSLRHTARAGKADSKHPSLNTLLLCDEPTSGLDSCSALSVMRLLKQLSQLQLSQPAGTFPGCGVLAALHQPRPAIWHLIDHVSVLVGGRLLYWGPTKQMVPWFNSVTLWGPYQPMIHGSEPDFVMEAVYSAQGDVNADASQTQWHVTLSHSCAQAADAFQHLLEQQGLIWWDTGGAESGGQLQHVVAGCGQQACPQHAQQHHMSDSSQATPAPPQHVCTSLDSGSNASDVCLVLPMSTDPAAVQHGSTRGEQSAHVGIAPSHTPCTPTGSVTQSWRMCCKQCRAAWQHTVLLTWREYVQLRADSVGPPLKLLMFTWSAVVMGLVFYGLDRVVGPTRLQLLASSTFMSCSVLLSLPYMSLLAFTADQAHSNREAAARRFGWLPRVTSKMAATLPLHLLCVLCYCCIMYGMLGFKPQPVPLLQHAVLASLLMLCAAQVMHASVVVCTSSDTAFMMTTCWAVVNMFFSGFFVRPDQLALRWLAPMRYLSALRLAYHGILRAELQGVVLACSPSQQAFSKADLTFVQHAFLSGGGQAGTALQSLGALAQAGWPQAPGGAGPNACAVHGDVILHSLGVDSSVAEAVGALLAYWVGLQVVTVVVQAWRWPR